MKKYIAIATLFIGTFTACKDQQKEASLVWERDSLMAVINEREATTNEIVLRFNEVERNLDSVAIKQHLILVNVSKSGDLKQNQKEKIDAEITAINNLMEQNKKKIKAMHGQLKTAGIKNSRLEETVRLLNKQLNTKFEELAVLNVQLERAYSQVDFLQVAVEMLVLQNMEQGMVIDSIANKLHTAYYIVAEMDDLKKLNIVDKRGGFLGMGKTAIPGNSPDLQLFIKIDYLNVTSIPVNSKNIKIISTHPTDSYSLDKIDKVVNSIMISDPEKFWSQSKYLIISK